MELGQIVATKGIMSKIKQSEEFAKFVVSSMIRYKACDWGDICGEDKAMNDSAVKNNDDRIVARYNNDKGNIYIITEWDRSATTILFINEY